jgi:hypothetical protein
MSEELQSGDLLFLTKAFEDYFHKKHPQSTILLANRIAKLEEIIDWDSPKGQQIKQARLASGKWKDLPLEDNRFIVSVYYHDILGRKGEKGVAERGVAMFRNDPVTGKPFFEKIPDWIYQEIMKKCEVFAVEKRDVTPMTPLEEKVQQFASEMSDVADASIVRAMSKKKTSNEEKP